MVSALAAPGDLRFPDHASILEFSAGCAESAVGSELSDRIDHGLPGSAVAT